jgi:hypothetical protein
VRIEGKDIVVTGIWPRTARLRDEWYAFLDTPEDSIRQLRASGIRADLFTFLQPVSDRVPRHPFHLEWSSAAVLPLRSYDDWWNIQINAKTRNMVRKAARSQVHVRCVDFNDDLIRGIHEICNETPLRQGRRFRHFGQDYEAIKRTHVTYLGRSEFLGAFFGAELIGFAKLVHGENASGLMHLLCKQRHRHRAPANALIAGAVEACTTRKVPHLFFGEWSRRGLGEFKKHNAFQRFSVPRYFVPLNATGRFLLGLNLHRDLRDRIPDRWQDTFVAWRSRWYAARYGRWVH